jgi:hypothetical protein
MIDLRYMALGRDPAGNASQSWPVDPPQLGFADGVVTALLPVEAMSAARGLASASSANAVDGSRDR